jgi:prepilin-type N-terminal cleavage/methylation domain-containing protein
MRPSALLGAIRRRFSARDSQRGFTLIEVLVGAVVLTVVSVGIVTGLSSASGMLARSEADSQADKVAASALENVDLLDYSSVGTPGGNPAGTLTPSTTKTVAGVQYRIDTTVRYVDDQTLGQAQTYADYKRVTVTATPLSGSGKAVSVSTIVAPPSFGTVNGKSTVAPTVTDLFDGTAIAGATVTVTDSVSSYGDTTDASGNAVIPALPPNPTSTSSPQYNYVLSAAYSGYIANPSAATMSQHLAAGQVWRPTISLVKPATLDITLHDGTTTGPNVPEYSTVTVTTPGGAQQTFSGTGGRFTVTAVNSAKLVPSSTQSYSVAVATDCHGTASTSTLKLAPTGYPSNTVQSYDPALTQQQHGDLDVTVKTKTGALATNASVTISGGGLTAPRTRPVDPTTAVAALCLPQTSARTYSVYATAPGASQSSTVTSPSVSMSPTRTALTLNLN